MPDIFFLGGGGGGGKQQILGPSLRGKKKLAFTPIPDYAHLDHPNRWSLPRQFNRYDFNSS